MAISPALVISNASPIGSDEANGGDVRPTADRRHRAGGHGAAADPPAEIPDEQAATLPPLSTAPVAVDDDSRRGRPATGHQRRDCLVIAIGASAFALWSRVETTRVVRTLAIWPTARRR